MESETERYESREGCQRGALAAQAAAALDGNPMDHIGGVGAGVEIQGGRHAGGVLVGDEGARQLELDGLELGAGLGVAGGGSAGGEGGEEADGAGEGEGGGGEGEEGERREEVHGEMVARWEVGREAGPAARRGWRWRGVAAF